LLPGKRGMPGFARVKLASRADIDARCRGES